MKYQHFSGVSVRLSGTSELLLICWVGTILTTSDGSEDTRKIDWVLNSDFLDAFHKKFGLGSLRRFAHTPELYRMQFLTRHTSDLEIILPLHNRYV